MEKIEQINITTMNADKVDRIFAWLTFLLGFGFVYTFTSEGMEWNLRVFTLVYATFIMAYSYAKKTSAKESYFWLGILCILGICYSEQGIIFPIFQVMVLILIAAYLVLCVGGNLFEQGKSSEWILVDGWNAMIVVPFSNFICHIKVLGSHETKEGRQYLRQFRNILIGFCIAIPVLFIVIPLLGSADAQFEKIFLDFGNYFHEGVFVFLIRFFLSLPITAYFFGSFYGSIHKRNTNHFSKAQIQQTMKVCRIVPDSTVYTALGILCAVYVLFIVLQANYLFSACFGIRPENYTYAEYARRGFFELCQICALNLFVLTIANSFSKTQRLENKVLRFVNIVLAVLTIALITTAMSKMVLYILAYGFTAKRIITMVFMIWLLVVFILMILWQFKKIPLVRISLIVGTCLYTLLCVLPIREWLVL